MGRDGVGTQTCTPGNRFHPLSDHVADQKFRQESEFVLSHAIAGGNLYLDPWG